MAESIAFATGTQSAVNLLARPLIERPLSLVSAPHQKTLHESPGLAPLETLITVSL
jgi:hypothetical protein